MKQRLQNMIIAILLIASNATAQSLMVDDVQLVAGLNETIVVKVEGASDMAALQFNLTLPDGIILNQDTKNYGITLGDATDDHTLEVFPLESGDYLVILYSMNLRTFADGNLLNIPVVAVDAVTSEGEIHTIRVSTVTAVSYGCADVTFALNIVGKEGDDVTGIENSAISNQNPTVIYDLTGRRVEKAEKGIYIVNGKKMVIK